jgi:hypothetical protein
MHCSIAANGKYLEQNIQCSIELFLIALRSGDPHPIVGHPIGRHAAAQPSPKAIKNRVLRVDRTHENREFSQGSQNVKTASRESLIHEKFRSGRPRNSSDLMKLREMKKPKFAFEKSESSWVSSESMFMF